MASSVTWHDGGIWRWRRHLMPILVWVLAAATASALLVRRSSMCELVGIADAQQRLIAAQADGRLRLVPVALFEPVKEGQPLAVLDDERIQALLATAGAEAARLRAELVATADRLTAEAALQEAKQMAEARSYAMDVESNRLRGIELQVTLETDRARLEYLRLQKELLTNLHEQRAISELKFKSAEADHRAMEKSISENEKALAQVRQDLQQARQRQEAFAEHHAEPPAIAQALEPLRAAVTVQERKIAELSLERSMLILKSPIDGVVSQLLRGAGESVRAGEPILTVAATRPATVIAYASSAQVTGLGPGSSVRLETIREGTARQSLDTRVQAVGPIVEQIPARLWRSPTVPEWGWPIKIAVPPEMEVACGELVGVSRP